MSTAAVSTSSIYQELQTYFQQRRGDLQQLGQALQSGDLTTAQQEYSAIQTLAQSGPFANGNAFQVSQRQQDFAAIGQALQAGDVAGAQQAFQQLQSTFHHTHEVPVAPPAVVVTLSGSSAGSSSGASSSGASSSGTSSSGTSSGSTQPTGSSAGSSAAAGPEIVLNLGNVTAGEQITIGLSGAGSGTEQLTLSVANQQNQNPEQVTINLSQNSNEQIVLNLFNSSTTSPAQGSGVNVTG